MKRKIIAMLVMVCVLLMTAMPAFALDLNTSQLVNDNAGLLTTSEKEALEAKAQSLTNEYGVEVRILTVNGTEGASSISNFSESVINSYHLGTGDNQSIIMLTIDMGEREYDLTAHGQGNDVMTDYGRSLIENDMVSHLSNGDYAEGFQVYLNNVEDFSYAYFVNGEAVDTYVGEGDTGSNALFMTFVALILACIVAALVVAAMAKQMKTARRGTQANQYLVKSQTTGTNAGKAGRSPMGLAMGLGIALSLANDDFLYTNRTVTPIVTPKNNGGGPHIGGGTSINSGGFSHSSGKF